MPLLLSVLRCPLFLSTKTDDALFLLYFIRNHFFISFCLSFIYLFILIIIFLYVTFGNLSDYISSVIIISEPSVSSELSTRFPSPGLSHTIAHVATITDIFGT